MMKKLLLADDSITIQKVVGIIFATEDYELTMTDDGDSAFEKALELIPDIVIADVSMPGKDGFELCRAIKNEPSLSHTSVMLLPGAFDHFDEVKAQDVCADGWLTKPFESQALLDKVAQLLEAEPVHMAGVSAASDNAQTVAADAGDEAVAAGTDVDEAALGLDALDELPATAEEPEESPEDIWDAVSFEEDDLLPEEGAEEEVPDTAATVEQLEEESHEANDFAEAADDDLDEADAGIDDFTVEDLLEQEDEGEQDIDSAELADSESFVAEEAQETESPVPEETFLSAEAEEGQATDDGETETEPVVFSPFAEQEVEVSAEETLSDDSASGAEADDEISLELTEDMVAESSVEEPAGLSSPVVDHEELESMEDELLAPMEDFPDAEDASTITAMPAVEESVIPASLEAVSELPEDESILDLSEEDIVEDKPEEELIEDIDAMTESDADMVENEPALADADAEEAFGESDADTDFVFNEESDQQDEPDAEEVATTEVSEWPGESTAEADEIDVQPEVAEDEGFYFDATAENEEADASAEGIIAGGPAVAAAGLPEQIEQQLRALSEEELKDVVARVAGPMIEKMAGELLEQIAWEVVPDLAEALIKEEIRKIKQAMSS